MFLLAAPAILTALTYDVGAHAYDAATEHIYRGAVFSQAVSDGVLYPRWVQFLHWGLGSPLFTFQPPLPYYGMDVLFRLGLSHPIGWRLLIAGGFATAFLGAYLLIREITGRRWPALVAATAFVYAPYVIRNALERGSNETYSMFLYPLVLWGLLWVSRRPTTGRFIAATLIWAACIASHVLGPLMLAPFAGVLALFLAWRRRTLAPPAALLAGGLLTAAIWLPMAPEQAWVHVQRDFEQPEAIPARNPIPLDALLAPPVVYDVARDNNNVGDRIGLAQSILLFGALPAAAVAWRRRREISGPLIGAAAAGLFLFWLLTPASNGLWQAAPVLGRLLYRTRLMGAQALFAALSAGLLIALLPTRRQQWAGLAACALFTVLALPSLYVELQHRYAVFRLPVDLAQVRGEEIRTHGTALTAFGEFTPRWRTAPFDDALLAELGPDFDPQARPLAHPPAGVKLLASRVRNQAWDLQIAATEPATLTLYLLYYPRWRATVDGQPIPLTPQAETGYVQLSVPVGTHDIALRYASTPAEMAGMALSAATLLGLLAVAGRALWQRKVTGPTAPPQEAPPADEPTPPLWLLIGLTGLLIFKFAYVDRHTTWLRCVSTAERVCGAQATVDVAFADAPRLRGYTVSSADVRRGAEVRVDLYWQGQQDTGQASNVKRQTSSGVLASFVHIRRSRPEQAPSPVTGGDIWAQAEHGTPGGLLTTEFLPGKLYKDEFRVRIPADMPPGEYFLEVGWFDPATGEQLDPLPETVKPPLRILWRSILLPSIRVQ
ncbi:MAG: hypothetical protein WHX53_02715 [Anaerolineae bacterium]